MTTQTREHPSNRLYRGDARSFDHACTLAIAAAQEEHRLTADLDRKYGLLPEDNGICRALEQYEAAAVTARGIHARVMAEMRPRLIAELRAAGLDDWADAYEHDDYTRLAI